MRLSYNGRGKPANGRPANGRAVARYNGSGYARFLGDTIEMDDDFTGDVASLPTCPCTRPDGWCADRASDGKALQYAVRPDFPCNKPGSPMSRNTKIAIAAAAVALFVLMK